MIKVLTVFDTLPAAIKIAPIIHVLYQESKIESKICVSAQKNEGSSSRAKSKKSIILESTSISDLYEILENSELEIDTPKILP